MHRGITLVEILVVIAIFLLLVSGGLISWRAYGASLKLTLSTRKIIQDLREAQSQSVAEQIFYLVRFDKQTSTYDIIYLNEVEEKVRQEELYSKIQIENISGLLNNEVKFNALGVPSDTGTIELKNEKEEIKTIEIKPSGYIKSY